MMRAKNRTKQINLRLTEDEFVTIKKRAEKAGISVTAYILKQAINKPALSKTDLQLVFQVQKIGNNINQITKLLHYESLSMLPGTNVKLLEELDKSLQHLQKISPDDSED